MGILIDNPTKGKKGCLWGIVLLVLGVMFAKYGGGILIFIGIILLVIGWIKHWYYN